MMQLSEESSEFLQRSRNSQIFQDSHASNCISPLPSYGRYFQIPPYKLVNFKMRLLSFYFLVKSTAAVPSLVVNLVEKVVML